MQFRWNVSSWLIVHFEWAGFLLEVLLKFFTVSSNWNAKLYSICLPFSPLIRSMTRDTIWVLWSDAPLITMLLFISVVFCLKSTIVIVNPNNFWDNILSHKDRLVIETYSAVGSVRCLTHWLTMPLTCNIYHHVAYTFRIYTWPSMCSSTSHN